MDFFSYRDGQLYCEDVPVDRIAKEFGTPVYIYSQATLKHHYDRIKAAYAEFDPMICYSVKSCGNLNILKKLHEWGSGFDVVSGGELFRVLQAGGDPGKVVYAGVGKTDVEINAALDAGIAYFNIESEEELANLARLARDKGKRAQCALRINPDVDPKTHRHTATGKRESKFGVDLDRAMTVFETFGKESSLSLSAVHLHLGSPIYSAEPYVEALEKTLPFIDALRAKGFAVDTLDLGGGLGADYQTGQTPPTLEYADKIIPMLRGQNLKLILEPGRSIAGNGGLLLTRVIYTKAGGDKRFLIVDAAMNDLIRPAFYGAFHFIWPVQVGDAFVPERREECPPMDGLEKVDVVGPICESGDFLAKERMLPPAQRGDLLGVFTAGAYAFTMSSQYNARPRAAEVLVDGGQCHLIRRRETYDDLVAAERV